MATTKSTSQPDQPAVHPRLQRPAEKTYYIVNPAGAVHEVNKEHATERLKQLGYRLATKDEVDLYHAQGRNQVFDRPIAQPWTPQIPDEQVLE